MVFDDPFEEKALRAADYIDDRTFESVSPSVLENIQRANELLRTSPTGASGRDLAGRAGGSSGLDLNLGQTFVILRKAAGAEEKRQEIPPAVPEVRWTVIGPSVARHFSGLEEFAGIERRVLVDPGDPEGRARMLVQMGETEAGAVAHYYGGLEEAQGLAAMAGRFMEIVPHSYREPGFLNQIDQALIRAGLPTELIAAGIEALAAGMEELRQAA